MPRILYLHGLESAANGSKATWLIDNFDCDAPHVDYYNPASFFHICNIIDKVGNYDLIIGSSMGAFFGMALSYKYHIPYLGFNPPIDPDLTIRAVDIHDDIIFKILMDFPFDGIQRTVVLGLLDDVVDPNYALDFLPMRETKVYAERHMGHRVPLEQLQKYLTIQLNTNDTN